MRFPFRYAPVIPPHAETGESDAARPEHPSAIEHAATNERLSRNRRTTILLAILGVSAALFLRTCIAPVPAKPVMVWRLRHLLVLPSFLLQACHYGAHLLLGAGLFTLPASVAVLYFASLGLISPNNRLRYKALAVWAQVQVQWTLGCAQYLDAGPAWSGGWVGSGLAHILVSLVGQVVAGLVVLLGDILVAAWWLGLPPTRLGTILVKGWTDWTILMEQFWGCWWHMAVAIPKWPLWGTLFNEVRVYLSALRRDLPKNGGSVTTTREKTTGAGVSGPPFDGARYDPASPLPRPVPQCEAVVCSQLKSEAGHGCLWATAHPESNGTREEGLVRDLARSRFLRTMFQKYSIENTDLRRKCIEVFPIQAPLEEGTFLLTLSRLSPSSLPKGGVAPPSA